MAAYYPEAGFGPSYSWPWGDPSYWTGSGYATEFPATGVMTLDDWWWDDLGAPSQHPSNQLEPPFGFSGYGAEGGAAGAGGAGAAGGGGGGQGAAVAGILEAVAAIVDGIFQGVALAKTTEAKPEVVAQTQTRMFTRRLQAIERLNDEIAQEQQKIREAKEWLVDPTRKASWMTGAVAMNATPRGAKWCDGLWEGQPRFKSPGGHRHGDPNCKCPTSNCAYRDPAAAGAKKAAIKDKAAKIQRIRDSRDEGNVDWPRKWGQGNLRAYRTELQHSWSLLMGLRAFEPLLKMHPYGATVLSKTPAANLLIGRESLEKIFPDDPDVAQGVVPFHVLNEQLGSWLNFAVAFPVMDGFRPPIWIYGLTPDEQRQIGIGPTIGAVRKMLEARDLSGSAFAGYHTGYDAFGSAFGAPGGMAGMVRQMLLSPAGRQQLAAAERIAAQANPASTQIANSPAAQAPPPAVDHLPRGPVYPSWMPWAVGLGAVTVAGLFGLLIWALI